MTDTVSLTKQCEIRDARQGGVCVILLTYYGELPVLVGYTEKRLAIGLPGGGVHVTVLWEGGEVRDTVGQPEALRVVKEQRPCTVHTNNRSSVYTLHTHL